MRVAALAAAISLAACAAIPPTVPPEVVVRTVTNEIKVPYPVRCFDPADRPPLPTPTPVDVERATTDQLAAATAADNAALADYARRVDALFTQCALKGTPP